MLGIGIIGGGRICAAHATSAQALVDTELVAIADVEPEKLAQQTQQFGCRGYADYRPLLEDPAVDAVVVALPHWMHREVTIAALHAGKHVFLEKPMAMTVAECDEMIAAARRSGKTLMVAHSQHFFPVNMAARKVIADGGIGNLVLATDTWYKGFWEGGKRPAWFLEDAQGGGMWSMNGSHMIDRLCFLTGDEVVAVKAKIGNPTFGLSTDMGTAMLQFKSGLHATIMHVGYREGVNRFEAEFTGTEGQLKLNGDRGGGDCYWIGRGGKWDEVAVPEPELPLKPGAQSKPSSYMGGEMHDFARAIIEVRAPAVTDEYGRMIVRVMEACEESSRGGHEVRLS